MISLPPDNRDATRRVPSRYHLPMIDLPPTNRPEAPEVDRPLRLGVVSFLNTLPLIDGLDRLADVELQHSVPSGLIDQLIDGHVDVALCSIVDYQRSPEPLVLVPSGLLGCHGRTMTVRLYSTRPIDQIQTVYCDTDSHTSIALMQVLLSERYGVRPTLIDYNAREHVAENRPIDWPDSVLLIGDKVVTDSPPAVRYTHQLDLGEAWNDFTGLPFVFAGWLARRDTPPGSPGDGRSGAGPRSAPQPSVDRRDHPPPCRRAALAGRSRTGVPR